MIVTSHCIQRVLFSSKLSSSINKEIIDELYDSIRPYILELYDSIRPYILSSRQHPREIVKGVMDNMNCLSHNSACFNAKRIRLSSITKSTIHLCKRRPEKEKEIMGALYITS